MLLKKTRNFNQTFLMGKVTRGNSSQFGLAVPVEVGKRSIRKKIAKINLKLQKMK